jgi:hypothetical protein
MERIDIYLAAGEDMYRVIYSNALGRAKDLTIQGPILLFFAIELARNYVKEKDLDKNAVKIHKTKNNPYYIGRIQYPK